jgi:hypothetical protein
VTHFRDKFATEASSGRLALGPLQPATHSGGATATISDWRLDSWGQIPDGISQSVTPLAIM